MSHRLKPHRLKRKNRKLNHNPEQTALNNSAYIPFVFFWHKMRSHAYCLTDLTSSVSDLLAMTWSTQLLPCCTAGRPESGHRLWVPTGPRPCTFSLTLTWKARRVTSLFKVAFWFLTLRVGRLLPSGEHVALRGLTAWGNTPSPPCQHLPLLLRTEVLY